MPPRRKTHLHDKQIGDLLAESELDDFLPSDEDICDPKYRFPEEQTTCSSSEKSSSESDNEVEETIHERGRAGRTARGRANRGRGGRGRGRGRDRGRARGQETSNDSQDTETNKVENSSSSSTVSRTVYSGNWNNGNIFCTRIPDLMQPAYPLTDTTGFDKINYLRQYIDDELIDLIVKNTNQTAVERNGRSMHLSAEELYVFLGATLVMATINYPNIRMYWEKKWRVAVIADNMPRNRFLMLRNALKIVFDPDVTTESRAKDKLWKMRPLIDRIVTGCRKQPKDQSLSIDEMIIPFTGSCSIKQYCPGKPNPVGLKAFVLVNPDGAVCDLHIYQGKTTYPNYENTDYGLGQKAVLTLTKYLVPGHILYFDRYFTSEKLLDELEKIGIRGTGTVMKNRIPGDVRSLLISDKQMKAQGRGTSQVLVRNDGLIAFVKWFDNKPVTFLSSVEAKDEADSCQRWCKKTKTYVTVPRPRVVREYNNKMGGVDLADRLLAVCPNRYRTRKWTQRCFSALVDLAICNSWLQYKKDQIASLIPLKKIMQLRAFKMDLGETLIKSYAMTDGEVPATSDQNDQEPNQRRKRGRAAFVPVPNKGFRNAGAKHLPYLAENAGRCRHCHYNRTQFKCRACNVSLCLTKLRNCFIEFHNDDE